VSRRKAAIVLGVLVLSVAALAGWPLWDEAAFWILVSVALYAGVPALAIWCLYRIVRPGKGTRAARR
jgi:hypothetical protein